MLKKSVIAAVLAMTSATAFAGFGGYVQTNTDNEIEYGLSTNFGPLGIALENWNDTDYTAYVNVGETVAVAGDLVFKPFVEYSYTTDTSFVKTGDAIYVQGMFNYPLATGLVGRAGGAYRFAEDDNTYRLKAGANFAASDAVNFDFDYEYRVGVQRGGFDADWKRHRYELKTTFTAVPVVAPYVTVGYKDHSVGGTDTYAVAGIGFAF